MVEQIEEDIKANVKEYISSGDDEIKKLRYNSAINAYFKAIVALCNLKIYEKIRTLPKNHSERFNTLRIHFPEAYKIVDSLFKKYTDSYNLRLKINDALVFKQNVENIKRIFKFE